MQHIERLYDLFSRHPVVVTDSRKIEPGCLFFALKGQRFNGNQFAEEALRQGAAYAVIDEARYQPDDRYILVENVLTALQQLATRHRRQFLNPVIGITGSNGKTTTKELVAAVLSSHYTTHYTRGNLNNHIGVPLTLLSLPLHAEVALIEMGANHQGEIAFLCEIAQPTHGIVTNIGKAHLEGFGSLDGVKKGKAELYQYLTAHNGVAFINLDEKYLEQLAAGVQWKIFYKKGSTPTSQRLPFEIQLLTEKPFISVAFATEQNTPVTVETNLIGYFNFNNIMTAIVVGIYFKVPAQKIKKAIENYVPANNRSQLIRIGTNTFLLDAYNANPSSMKKALLSFSKITAPNKIAILGAMKELGKYAPNEHSEIVELANHFDFQKIILVGEEYQGMGQQVFKDTGELKDWFEKQDFQNTYFLLKGSRSVGLEKLLPTGRV